MGRTLKDKDIARAVALKAGVEMTVAFKDLIQQQGQNASDMAIKAADKFYGWLIAERPEDREQDGDNYFAMILNEIHTLQRKLELKPTDFDKDPCPYAKTWSEGGAQSLLEALRARMKTGSKAGSFAGDTDKEGWTKRSIYGAELGNGDYPISKKQFGYLVALHKRNNLKYDKDELNALTTRQASSMIDELLASGNGE